MTQNCMWIELEMWHVFELSRILISRDVIFDEIKEVQQPITSYQQAVTSYISEKLIPVVLENAQTTPVEARI